MQRASQRKKKPRPKKLADAAVKDDSAEEYSSDSEEDYSGDEDEGKSGYKKGGYHPVTIGDTFKAGRYKVIRKLGWGHFSTVWLVSDSKTNANAALKIVKSVSHYAAAARDEIQLLKVATERDPVGEKYCVRLIDHFEHRGPHGTHVCMVLEALGCNLLDLLKIFNNRGLPVPMVKCIAKQVLTGLDFLHRQSAIIHTDLKPENVLLLATPQLEALPSKPTVLPPGAPTPVVDDKGADAQSKTYLKNMKKRQKAKAKRQAAKGPAAPTSESHVLNTSNKSASFHHSSSSVLQPPPMLSSNSALFSSADHSSEVSRAKLKPEDQGVPSPASPHSVSTSSAPSQHPSSDLTLAIAQQPPSASAKPVAPVEPVAVSAPAGTVAATVESGADTAPVTTSTNATTAPTAPATTSAALGAGEKPAAAGDAPPTSDAPPDKPPLVPGVRRVLYDPKRNASRIADFGNACWVHKHFTDNVQTREYRSPEVIIGAKYNTTCDIWSMACMTFELLTGDLLFEPKESDSFGKNDDHLAQMVELLGRIPKAFALSGRMSKDFFTRTGDLRNISELNFWPLEKVLEEKYKYSQKDAAEISSFLGQMLKFNPLQRASAQECLRHSWLAEAEKGASAGVYDLPRRRIKPVKPPSPAASPDDDEASEPGEESEKEDGETDE